MVSIVWKDEATGLTREKLKHPDLLVQLEEGLEVEQDTSEERIARLCTVSKSLRT